MRTLTLTVAVLVASLLCRGALADAILETHDASLTIYVPSSKSGIQDIRPQHAQRGVDLDGSRRLGLRGMSIAGNPSPSRWNGNASLVGTRLETGTFTIDDVDISLPATVPWVIGRSYNTRQKDSEQGAGLWEGDSKLAAIFCTDRPV